MLETTEGVLPSEWLTSLVPNRPEWTPLFLAQRFFGLTEDELFKQIFNWPQRQGNPDEDLRRYQRSGFSGDIQAESRYLLHRIRAGTLDPHHVELAAYLGHKASLQPRLFPEPVLPEPLEPIEQNTWTNVRQILRRGNLDHSLLVTIAADFAEHVLLFWLRSYPDDDRPAKAIQAARDWVSGILGGIDRIGGLDRQLGRS